eukprot:TRINITY_DN4726_c0_g1_i8.p2 TRINITY_DN4726_c0_g1~~TRINITY_DN4726_c0_g1_i8.p2  ORF type:complete len:439 (-),score=118.01 TRINITY_DN4726_c0_g1_i8:16-1332(-)
MAVDQKLLDKKAARSPAAASAKTISTTDVDSAAETASVASDASSTPSSSVSNYSTPLKGDLDPNLWYIYGHGYDLKEFVAKHPGGQLAILSGQGRDCTALFESYHPWNDKHRKTLKAYGPAPPADDPFYMELKQAVRKAYPGGAAATKMPTLTFATLLALQTLNMYLFFVHKTFLSCMAAGFLMATIGTRLAHEGGHYQCSMKPWVNRLALFYGYLPTGPSMCWHYQHVISHHAHTNQEHDCDVEYIWMADMLPPWMKKISTLTLGIGVMFEIGLKRIVVDLLLRRCVGGNRVYWHKGYLIPEAIVWFAFHYYFGPSMLHYLAMYFVAGSVFVPMSQVAHAIVFPDFKKHDSWAKMQIAESVDFATDSEFWFHMAFGLTTQIEHHLFPSIGHCCYDTIRKLVAPIAKAHGVTYMDLPAGKALSALWYRWVNGVPLPLA